MTGDALAAAPRRPLVVRRPRLAFVGTGWIGRSRLEAIVGSGVAEVAVVAEPSAAAARAALTIAPDARVVDDLDAALATDDLDGVVIATPSAAHAEQAIRALERGLAVFCQKPLGRDAAETRAVVAAARAADRLLGVDLSYRDTAAMRAVRDVVRSGDLGPIYAADLVFHNAYGPDKPWFYDRAQSGGGCVIDLGIHLVDLALWVLAGASGEPRVVAVTSRLFARGRRLALPPDGVEDYAEATLELASGAVVRLACSWNLAAGRDAVIGATFYGPDGGVAFRNVGGSFYDFVAERYRGTAREELVSPPDAWSGRAATEWAARVARGDRFDSTAERLVDVAAMVDALYGRTAHEGEHHGSRKTDDGS